MNTSNTERDVMEFDVVIIGAGPAGLATAIRLMQEAEQKNKALSVIVLEKGAEVGAHILSGAVIDPSSLNKLWPNWKEDGAPLKTEVTVESINYLGKTKKVTFPNFLLPPLMKNHGCYIASLGQLCRWLAEKAESLGVEIYPGFAAQEVLYDNEGSVKGVTMGDMGVGRDGNPKNTYTPGMEIHGKYTIFAEGVRGSLSKQIISKFNLNEESDFQKYGIGIKELWEVPQNKHKPGYVQHTMGWPLDNKTGGGSFLYHFGENLVSVGFVIHLNYENPHISPYDEFQRLKTHPSVRDLFVGGRRLSYGARAITEGGWQSVPKLVFPGGALVGCSAGFVNLPRIKGTHNAIATGMMAADAIINAVSEGRQNDVLNEYEETYKQSSVEKELKCVRNVKPLLSRFGTLFGTMISGAEMWLNTLLPFLGYTLKHGKPDHACTKPAFECEKIAYPKPDGEITFDKLSSVFLSGTNHEEDQPCHLVLADPDIPIKENLPLYDEPAQRYCPAGVYEVVEENLGKRFQINSQNCVHCKTCDIKDPAQNITWVSPEGAGGPNYSNM